MLITAISTIGGLYNNRAYVTLGVSRVLALLLLLLAPVASFRGYLLYPINIFLSIPLRST